MGNGNIDVGNETATRKSGQQIDERPSGLHRASELRIKAEQPEISGPMSQQGGHVMGDNECAQQKLVRLVGCRDPKARLTSFESRMRQFDRTER